MKLRWREMQALHGLTTDLHTGWIGVLSQLGLDGETRGGRGMTNSIDGHLVTDQRPPPPMLGHMTQHPMFDLLPLPGPRRTVPDVARDPEERAASVGAGRFDQKRDSRTVGDFGTVVHGMITESIVWLRKKNLKPLTKKLNKFPQSLNDKPAEL